MLHQRVRRAVPWALGLTLAGSVALGAPVKWRNHELWQEVMAASRPVERWFLPGALGHEQGRTPPRPSERAFLTRAMGGGGRYDENAWAGHNRLTPRLSFSHNLGSVFPPALYGEHPEYFPEEKGKRIRPPDGAQWWNPDLGREDVAAFAAGAAEDFFKAHPEAVSFALGVNDGLVFGDSSETRGLTVPVRWFRNRPDYSNLVFTFMNRVAASTERKFPDKYLGALAYYWCENTPGFPIDPHVIPFLTADRSQGYDPAFVKEDKALQKRWVEALRAGAKGKEPDFAKASARQVGDRKLGGNKVLGPASSQPTVSKHPSFATRLVSLVRPIFHLRYPISDTPRLRLGLFDYEDGSGFLIPRLFPHLLAEHLCYTRRLGFTDYYAEAYPNWGLAGAQPWLVAQLLQDPEQSVDRLLNEYYRRYFKEAARPMQAFYERCEQLWMRQSGPPYWLKYYRNENQAVLFPPEACADLRGYIDQAMRLASNPIVQARVQQVSDAFGVTERFVAMQFARDQLNRAVLGDTGTPVEYWSKLLDFQKKRREFVHYTKDLQARQPLLIAPFDFGDYLKHDPTINTLMRLAQVGFVPPSDDTLETLANERLLADLKQPRHEIVRNGVLEGPLEAPRILADLPFSVSLPKEWRSTVEPVQHYKATLLGESPRVLRLIGCKRTAVFQWNRTKPEGFGLVGVKLRGKLSPSTQVILAIDWVDAKNNHLLIKRQLLPTGSWPDWVQLWQGGEAPEGAVFVGIGLTVVDQGPGDWLEAKDFEVLTSPKP